MNQHGRLRVSIFPDMMFQQNALVVTCEGWPDCWIVDPGLPSTPDEIVEDVRSRSLTPVAILLTHCHADHIAGVTPIRERFPSLPLLAPRDELHMLRDARANLSEGMGFAITAPSADRPLSPGDELTLADTRWRVLDVSGHSPGGLAFYCAGEGVVIGGDALFCGSIGRYDFHNSDRERLLRNIRDHLLTLPDETVLYAGHGPITTVGNERKYNRVLKAELVDAALDD